MACMTCEAVTSKVTTLLWDRSVLISIVIIIRKGHINKHINSKALLHAMGIHARKNVQCVNG